MATNWELSKLHAVRLPNRSKRKTSIRQSKYSVDIQVVSSTEPYTLTKKFPLYMIGDQKQQDSLRSFSAEPSTAKLKLSVYVSHTLVPREKIGEAEETIEDLLSNRDQNGVASLNIFNAKREAVGEVSFKLEAHSDVKSMKGVVSQALSTTTSSPPQTLLTIGDGITQADQVVQGASAFGDTLKSVCTGLKFLQNLGDTLSEIHPYAKFAWTVLTCIVEVVQKQIELDQNVQSLAEAMKDTFDLVMRYEEKYLITKSTVILRMVQQTTECGSFIHHYWGTGTNLRFGKRALKNMISSPQDKVDEFKNKFSELRDVFTAEKISDVELVLCRVEDVLKELHGELESHIIETRLNDVPRAKGARFSPTKICLPGTRVAVQDMLYRWIATGGRLEEDGPRTSVFLLHGMAGTGKSTIANTVSSVLNGTGRGTSYRFSRDDRNDRKAENFFSTIALGMAGLEESYRLKLAEVLQDQSLRSSTDPSEQYAKFILEPMRSLTGVGVITNVVDAVDECASRQSILDIISKGDFPETLRFIIIARPENDIMSALQDKPHVFTQGINELSVQSIHSDIKTYIHHRLSKTQITDDQLEQLASNAEGLFQWAATACDYITNPEGRAGISSRKRLDNVLSPASSLNGLDSLYSAILKERFPDTDSEVQTVKTLLATLLAASEPLSLTILNAVCTKEVVESVIPYLGSLLIATGSEQIRPVHTSFRDYLTDLSRSKQFYVDLLEGHRALAFSSFSIMREQLRFNICNIKTSYHLNSELALDLNYISPELFYSCRFWSDHLAQIQSIDIDECTQTDVSYFMKNQILFWLEVLSLCRCSNFAKPALQRLIHCPVTWKDSDIVPFAEATIELIKYYSLPIWSSVPHIYISALALSPPSSCLGRHYSTQYHLMQCSGHTGADYIQAVLHSQHEVNCIAISSDGKKIVSAGGPEICLWDVETMQAVGEPLRKGYNFVTAVAFSPDGKMIASTGTNSNVIHIWDAEKMEEVGKLLNTSNQNKDYTYLNEDDMHLNTVTAIAFSPNGKRIVTGSELVYNTVIRIWDVEKMEAVGEPLNCDGSWVECVAFSHNGKRVVSGLGSHEIRVWDVENMIAVGEPLNSHASVVKSVAFSDDDKKIVSAGEDGIHVWDAEKMKVIAESKDRQRYGVKSVAFSPDSTWIVSGSWSNTICVRDAEKLTTVGEPLTGHTDDVTSVAFSRDGKRIISGSRDKTIRIWDAEKIGRARQPRKCHDGEVKSVAFSPDGTKIISGSTDMTVRIWDTKKMEAVGEPLRAHHCPVSSATFSPDGSRMVSSSVDGIVHIWDTKDLMEPVGEPLNANSICRTVDIWAMELDGESLDRESNYRKLASVVSVLFSSDGKRILSRSQSPYKGEMICMWDADNDEKIELSSDPSYGHIKTEVVPLPDGRERVSRHLGFTSWDHDKESNDSLLNPVRFDSINSAAFSQDDKRIVCATMDGMIHVWNAEKEVAGPPLMGHNDDSVQSLAFSPDGNRIVSGSKDGTIRVWDAEQVDPALTHNSPSQFTLFKRAALSTYLNPSCTLQPDGWVTGPNSEHFLWIPAYLRNQFPYPYLLGILSGDPMLQFDDTNFCYGENWTKCNKKG